jgi:hypothetical protein
VDRNVNVLGNGTMCDSPTACAVSGTVGLLAAVLLAGCGGAQIQPTAPRVGPPLTDVRGPVEEAASNLGIAGATVAIADGPSAGQRAVTDATGAFTLKDVVESPTFTVSVAATDFVAQTVAVVNGSDPVIRLDVETVTLQWQGILGPGLPNDDRTLTIRHRGPMHARLETTCRLGASEDGPVFLQLSRQPFNPYPSSYVLFLNDDSYHSLLDRTDTLDPGTYYLRARVLPALPVPPQLASCTWSIQFTYPR